VQVLFPKILGENEINVQNLIFETGFFIGVTVAQTAKSVFQHDPNTTNAPKHV